MKTPSPNLLAGTLALAASWLAFAPVVAAGEPPSLGDPAPPLVVSADEGVVTDWEALRGHVVVLEFWATWCAPCIPALDHLGRLEREFAGDGVRFLGISPETPERIERFLESREVAFPIALDRDNATFEAYGVKIVPTTIVVDGNGRLVARTRPEQLTAAVLRRVLAGEPAGLEVVHDVQSNIDWEPESTEEGEVYARVVIADSDSSSGGMRFAPGSGRISGDGMHRDNMLQIAYDVPNTRILNKLPAWSRDDPVYKLSVLAPGQDDELARRMLAGALEVKFRFTARRVEHETDVLVLARDPSVRDWPESTAAQGDWKRSAYGGGVDYTGQPIAELCDWFENITGKPVEDETLLGGRYDIEMEWVDNRSFTEELARYGLELIPERRAIEVLLVEPL